MSSIEFNKLTSRERIRESGLPVVIYGMGNGADRVLDEFEKMNIPVMGVTASDEFVRGQAFRGFTVKKLSEFSGDFIICPAFGTNRPEVMEKLRLLNNKCKVIVPVEPVFGEEIFDREFYEKNYDRINEAASLFSGFSRRVYEGCIEFILTGELDTLFEITTPKCEIFNEFLHPGRQEHFLDLGAYRGDTVRELLSYTDGSYGEITAVEPDVKNFGKLCKEFGGAHDFTAVCKAVSDRDGKVRFSSLAGRQSSVSQDGTETECTCIDTLCAGRKITFIKMDIEGAEKEGIAGGRNTISLQKPKLNIALYHRSRDIFELPLLIKSINPDYEFALRRHPYIPCWDLNLYCR